MPVQNVGGTETEQRHVARMAGPADEVLRPARLHALFANVDYFLEPAPEKIQTKFGAAAWKHELTELACPPAK